MLSRVVLYIFFIPWKRLFSVSTIVYCYPTKKTYPQHDNNLSQDIASPKGLQVRQPKLRSAMLIRAFAVLPKTYYIFDSPQSVLRGHWSDCTGTQWSESSPKRLPSRHMTSIQRRLNVDAMSWHCIDVEATLYKRYARWVGAYAILLEWLFPGAIDNVYN